MRYATQRPNDALCDPNPRNNAMKNTKDINAGEDSQQQLAMPRPKYRMHVWGNTKTGEPVFGVQAQCGKWSRWMHCCHGTTPLLYKTRETARRIVRWLNDPKGTEPEWTQDAAA